MALKLNIVLKTTEFLLVAYILLDLYASTFLGPKNVAVFSVDGTVGLNATNDHPKVVGIGKFAVDEYNRLTNGDLKLQSVVRAMFVQSSYVVLIRVKDRSISETKQYVAIVKMQSSGVRLIAFEKYEQYMDSVM